MKANLLENKKGHIAVLLITLLAVFLPVFFIERSFLSYTGGIFSYPIDDAYIHMQVAKNLSLHGNWGINQTEFGSASSSILYTLLLAASFSIFSNGVLIPFIINCIAAIFLLIVIQQWLRKQNINNAGQLVILLAVIFFTPLPVIIISGMEHTLQCLFTFLFLFNFSDWLQKIKEQDNKKLKLPWKVFLYALLMATTRYEGFFFIAIACLALLYYKKIAIAFYLGIVASLPIIIFGIYSVSKGSYFLPNSVLIKSELAQFSLAGFAHSLKNILIDKFTFSKTGITLLATQRLLIILPFTYLLFIKQLKQNFAYRFLLKALTACTFLHLALSDTGWFYRYEAYLMACSIVIIAAIIYKYGRELIQEKSKAALWLIAIITSFLFLPLFLRTSAGFSKAKQASINIYEQQYQMGQFVKKFYNNSTVAANDIGAVSYYTGANILDLWGLGNIEVARSRKGGYWTDVFINDISLQKNTKIAMIYVSWIRNSIPKHWKKIATWQIQNNVICGDDFVTFYAVDLNAAEALKNNLQTYQPSLPPMVKVAYY